MHLTSKKLYCLCLLGHMEFLCVSGELATLRGYAFSIGFLSFWEIRGGASSCVHLVLDESGTRCTQNDVSPLIFTIFSLTMRENLSFFSTTDEQEGIACASTCTKTSVTMGRTARVHA